MPFSQKKKQKKKTATTTTVTQHDWKFDTLKHAVLYAVMKPLHL